jgi:hypothetical protein
MRTRTILFISLIVLTSAACMTGSPARAADDFPVRAPAALPGTTEAMNDPTFWIDRIDAPDDVLMSSDEIVAFNRKNANRRIPDGHPYAENIAATEAEGASFHRMQPLDLGDAYDSAPVRARLDVHAGQLADLTFYDSWDLPFTDAKKQDILAAMNLDALPAVIAPRTAIIVRNTSARLLPTVEPGYRMRGYLDNINITSLDRYMPVAVLHASAAGDYLYAMTPIAWGWIAAEDVAFGSRDDIIAVQGDSSQRVVAIDHRLPIYADAARTVHVGWLKMGEWASAGRKTDEGWRIRIPARRYDGTLGVETAWIAPDAPVHEGWLPYSRRNTYTLAFRLLGRPYGWHDSWNERDCGGIMRVIFNCFGFTLPRYWSFEQLMSDHATHVGDLTVPEKNRLLADLPPGATFTGSTRHIGLYLGTVDDTPYVIHQCGWNYTEDSIEYKMARVVVSDYEHVGFNMDGIQFMTPVLP